MSEEYDEGELKHIGILRRSGRYPWGSGKDAYQRSMDFKAHYEELKKKNLTPAQIAEGLGFVNDVTGKPSTTELRAAIAISTEQIFAANQARAAYLTDSQSGRGMSISAAARQMGTNESTVRGWLKASQGIKEGSLRATADALKGQLESKPYLDVGKGTHLYMGVSETKLRTALAMLKDEGYNIHPVKLPQLGTDKMTTFKVLTKGDIPWSEAKNAVVGGQLKVITKQSDDGGLTFKTPKAQPVSVDSKRIEVRWGPDGGKQMDGVIELRRNIEDLSLGASRYAQVRVAVDGTHYLKGMAMYADDLPKGVDIRFNTNKERSDNKLDAMKPMKELSKGKVDPDNPFGATTHPKVYVDKSGKEKTSPLNIVNEEGKWEDWSKSLSSQMLSKQSITLASKQLGEARSSREKELDTILSLTNPVVKHKLLEDFAETADAAAVHLKAAALPRQSTHVILPMNSVRPHEIYAPNFEPGEKVVLVRHPHGGPFEIPELTVNNRNPQARRILSNAKDAVGIHHSVADQLSGADFDGDTVLVIPNNDRSIKHVKAYKELQEFDPKAAYPGYEGMKPMSKKNTQTEMGKISNLITDMSIHNANKDEIVRAVKHSMVVIDAEKHGLNYKQSELDQGIKQLKVKYQGGPTKGASTIISRASSEARVPQRKYLTGTRGINPKTGEKVFIETGDTRTVTKTKTYKRTGETVTRTEVVPKETKGTKMEFAKDARTLMSDKDPQPMERTYAEHANAMKALGNRARKETLGIKMPKQSAAAKHHYAKEVASLDAKLKIAQRNAPLERRAQAIGNATAKAKIDSHPEWDKDDIKKAKFQSLEDARQLTGANKIKIGALDEHGHSTLTDREWEAIQAGAVSATKLREILTHADMDRVKELSTPRRRTSLTPGQLARVKQMSASGRSTSEIAAELGLPRSTVVDNLKLG